MNNSKSTSNYDDDLNLKKYPIPSPITSHSKIRENNQTLAENFNFSMSINHLHFKKTATKTKQTLESTDKISTQTPKETQKKILPSSSDRIFNYENFSPILNNSKQNLSLNNVSITPNEHHLLYNNNPQHTAL